jgi:hypothetical protein
LPALLSETVDHARNFSEIMHGAPLLYNLMLSEQADFGEGVAKFRNEFANWTKLLAKG